MKECPFCIRKCRTPKHLRRHMMRKHAKKVDEQKLYEIKIPESIINRD